MMKYLNFIAIYLRVDDSVRVSSSFLHSTNSTVEEGY
jgi:hypothetical protein